jgi:hypothetical protein
MYVYLFVLLKYTENKIPYTEFIKIVIPSIPRIYGTVFSTYAEDIWTRIFYVYRGYTEPYILHIQRIYGIVFSTYTDDIRNRIFCIYREYTESYFQYIQGIYGITFLCCTQDIQNCIFEIKEGTDNNKNMHLHISDTYT